jgi:hypothetical protein
VTEVLLELLRVVTILAGLGALLLTVYVGYVYAFEFYPSLTAEQQKLHRPPATVLKMGLSYALLLAVAIAFAIGRLGEDSLSWLVPVILASEALAIEWLVGLVRR